MHVHKTSMKQTQVKTTMALKLIKNLDTVACFKTEIVYNEHE